jgi:hypothetical protein
LASHAAEPPARPAEGQWQSSPQATPLRALWFVFRAQRLERVFGGRSPNLLCRLAPEFRIPMSYPGDPAVAKIT